ncbi:lectin [Kutzneria buriramensis]|uniref:Putative alpha-1,2-mannosidase n=1 Tax=Kutzneria buriramensis TaxID=1045776 RepID=A0A3E0HHY4_9PSEU|nr:lectin [Kutzneria buriramensis]REH46043.1 putative alpha-1,2-mannosidase [Kutzneria buriramensis]
MTRSRPLSRALLVAAGTSVACLLPMVDAVASPAGYVADPAATVNPFLGTSNAFDDFPGADVPFGMVQWSPDTPSRPAGGGYEYTDKSITGFSLNHISGPGCDALGDVPILPTVGAVGTSPGAATVPLDHTQEQAAPGYYAVTAGGVKSELTTTTRSGMGRFTFPAGAASNLLFKLSDSAAGTDATHFQVINDHEVAGWVTSGHFCGAADKYTVYFDMTFDQSFTAQGTWQNSTVAAGATSLDAKSTAPQADPSQTKKSPHAPIYHGTTPQGTKATAPLVSPPVSGADGAYLTFDTTKNQTVQAKVGLSYVSTDNAVANRTKENPGWNFAGVKSAAHTAWNGLLDKIQIGGGTAAQQQVFYTALYHALLHPNVVSDVNGEYMGFDDQPHYVAKGHLQYGNYSGWDIYRSQVQLASIVAPQQTSDSIRSMLNDYDQTGQLPKWSLNNGESYVMVGDPADPIIADAYAFGARDFDTKHALEAMLAEANKTSNIRPGANYYDTQGYLPMDGTYGCCNFYGPVSTQLEYNTADHALSTYAAALGDSADAAALAARAQNWQNVFNPGSGFFQPKYNNGQFQTGFTPSSGNGFVEADAYQYTPMVPFDIKGLVQASGGNDAWVKRLDGLMASIGPDGGPQNADLSNEPSIEIPWEYDYVGAPYKAQAAVRKAQNELWQDKPAGVGNDDLGTMSAWYVFSALGMYPETPGSDTMVLGSPLFPQAAVHLASGKTLTITAPQAAPDAPYVQSLSVDGKAYTHTFLPTGELTRGGTLAYQLGTTPNTSWGTAPADAPPSDTTNLLPALGYTNPSAQLIVNTGSTTTVPVGAHSMSASAQTVSWTATAQTGLSVGPANGTMTVPAGGDGKQELSVTAPTAEGRYLLTVTMTSSTGATLPKVLLEIDVAKPGSLWPYYNNSGVATDGKSSPGDYDGDGYGYSAKALAAAGVTSGATVTADGLNYQWPTADADQPDNIEAGGQTIPLTAPAGAAKIGLLGSATNADPGSKGTLTVHYTDGSSQQIAIGLSDWTLGGGAGKVAFGNTIAVTTPYRDIVGSGKTENVKTYLFAADSALQAGKTVSSVTLPPDIDQGQFHVFSIAFG